MNKLGFWLVLAASLIATVGQILYKYSSESIAISFSGIFLNYYLIGGLFCYFLSAVLLITALKSLELSTAYPLFSLSYIFVAVASPFFFADDKINALKTAGILLIIAGAYFIGRQKK